MTVSLRPLGKVSNIIQSTGLEMSYAYDDLVFSDNLVFIVRFDNMRETDLHVYFNVDCATDEKSKIEQQLIHAAKIEKCRICDFGSFSIEQLDDKEELKINFK